MVSFDVEPIREWGLFPLEGPCMIAGPCSAESESQMMATASFLHETGVNVLRAGIWKPRTHPGAFEGAGSEALEWLCNAGRRFGLRTCTEVAGAAHVGECLRAGVDAVWIGARTSGNPFLVQEIAGALSGTDIPVFVKNPLNPDLELWTGTLERLSLAGLRRIALVHRGFSIPGHSRYRNEPEWNLILQMRSMHPEIPILCDPSHMGGDSRHVPELSRISLDMGYDGLMVEVHPDPSSALSDSRQQLSPDQFRSMLSTLSLRNCDSDDYVYRKRLEELRARIDSLDDEMMRILSERMETCREIGELKSEYNVSIVQSSRWDKVLAGAVASAEDYRLDSSFVRDVFNLIHEASVKVQNHKTL